MDAKNSARETQMNTTSNGSSTFLYKTVFNSSNALKK